MWYGVEVLVPKLSSTQHCWFGKHPLISLRLKSLWLMRLWMTSLRLTNRSQL